MNVLRKIIITLPNGRIAEYSSAEFEQFGNELEHKNENIIINTNEPQNSFIYELNERNEIENKEFITNIEFVE